MTGTTVELGLMGMKAVLSLHPVGGLLASLIGDVQNQVGSRSIKRLIDALQGEIERLGDRLDASKVDRPEFAELFASCVAAAVRTTDETRLRASARILANHMLPQGDRDRLSYSELDHFARSLETLPLVAYAVLGAAYQGVDATHLSMLDFGTILDRARSVDASLIMAAVNALDGAGLLQKASVVLSDLRHHRVLHTALGAKFVRHVLALRSEA